MKQNSRARLYVQERKKSYDEFSILPTKMREIQKYDTGRDVIENEEPMRLGPPGGVIVLCLP